MLIEHVLIDDLHQVALERLFKDQSLPVAAKSLSLFDPSGRVDAGGVAVNPQAERQWE